MSSSAIPESTLGCVLMQWAGSLHGMRLIGRVQVSVWQFQWLSYASRVTQLVYTIRVCVQLYIVPFPLLAPSRCLVFVGWR